MDVQLPAVMNVNEVAAYLRIPRASVYKLAQRGKIPCQKAGRHWRFRREAIDRWLEASPGSTLGAADLAPSSGLARHKRSK
jgi:excisionase family DNA binding protein